MDNQNKFQSDEERLEELESALQRVHELLHMGKKDTARTLARDVLSRYERDLKFVTAKTETEELGDVTLEFLDE